LLRNKIYRHHRRRRHRQQQQQQQQQQKHGLDPFSPFWLLNISVIKFIFVLGFFMNT
jgi:hypothetical protein